MSSNEGQEIAEVPLRGRGRPRSPTSTIKLHVSLPESLLGRLDEIQRDAHATSITEVVKGALALYAVAVEEHKNGGYMYVKRDGVERQIAIFI